jgi:hypothetical protein
MAKFEQNPKVWYCQPTIINGRLEPLLPAFTVVGLHHE